MTSGVRTLRSTSVFKPQTVYRLLAIVPFLLVCMPVVSLLAEPLLTPAPRPLAWTDEELPLSALRTVVAVTEEEQQVARVLRDEMLRLHGVRVSVQEQARARGTVVLALTSSRAGKLWLAKADGRSLWEVNHNEEAYLLEVSDSEAVLLADSPRGLLYGVQTLLQLVRADGSGQGMELAGARIVDYPQLSFRGIHICVFPNTELVAVRQAILLAARFKYNAVVIEFWSSLQSAKRPETAYGGAYTPAQIRPLIELGRALHMEMIPMLNSWGHASGMRSRSSEHVVLDRFPGMKGLYEANGWSFCLTNPAIYDQLFDRYDELMELFDHPKYFHLGMDEAWGHRGLMENRECRGPDPMKTLTHHLNKLYQYFAKRNVKVFMWHDMFIQRDHPTLGRLSPANSIPPFNSHLALDSLPKDIIIAAWNYAEIEEWPVPGYFHDKGYPVVVCPWKTKLNAVSLLNTAKNLKLLGVMETTWDSLDVSLPTVAETGVLAWTEPGFELHQVPFDYWLGAIRQFPIRDLPKLETTLGR
jgi:hypothetical protein